MLMTLAQDEDLTRLVRTLIENQAPRDTLSISLGVIFTGLAMFAAVVVFIVRQEGTIRVLKALAEEQQEQHSREITAVHARIRRLEDTDQDRTRRQDNLMNQVLGLLQGLSKGLGEERRRHHPSHPHPGHNQD